MAERPRGDSPQVAVVGGSRRVLRDLRKASREKKESDEAKRLKEEAKVRRKNNRRR